MTVEQQASELYRAGYSMKAIAEKIGRSTSTVCAYLQNAGVQARPQGHHATTRARAADLYGSGLSANEVAVVLGVTGSTVARWLAASGVKARQRGLRKEAHPQWRGGRRLTKEGYVRLATGKSRPQYVYEHIVVAEQAIGRKLRRNETVHHKNSIKSDNRPENLEVMTRAQHMRVHHHQPACLELADAQIEVGGGEVKVVPSRCPAARCAAPVHAPNWPGRRASAGPRGFHDRSWQAERDPDNPHRGL